MNPETIDAVHVGYARLSLAPWPILPDELLGCPYGTGLANMCRMGSETAAKKFCRLGCSPNCPHFMIHDSRKGGKW